MFKQICNFKEKIIELKLDYSIPINEMIERDYNINAKLSREELTKMSSFSE